MLRVLSRAARKKPAARPQATQRDRVDARDLQRLVESVQLQGRPTPHGPARASGRGARRVFSRPAMLKSSLALLAAVWIAGAAVVSWHLAPDYARFADSYDALATVSTTSMAWFATPQATDASARHATASVQADSMMATFDNANQTGLVALRGYLLTGGAGFHDEWEAAMARLEAAQTSMEIDSHGWTRGERIVELRDMRKIVASMRHEETLLAELAATPNRYPGLRLYREDTDKAFERATVLIDETLRSVLASNWAGAADRVDGLAHIRADLRDMRASLNVYLPSPAVAPPGRLVRKHASFLAALPTLVAMRDKVSPEDQGRIDQVHALLLNAETQLQQIMALKLTARWDYADFAFKQKVMPLSQKISAIIAGWRAAG